MKIDAIPWSISVYIQVGAGAGDSDARADNRDGFSSFVKSLSLKPEDRIVVVEAKKHNLEALKSSWIKFSNVSVYQYAICQSKNKLEDTIELFYSLDDGPHFQISSTLKNHVRKFYSDSSIRSFLVPCLDINVFLKLTCHGDQIELLATDIEGMDVPILNELDLSIFNIRKISFERGHSGIDIDNLKRKLRSAGYCKAGMGMDPHNSDVLWIKPYNLKERFEVYKVNLRHAFWEFQIPTRHFLKTKLMQLRAEKA